MLASWPNRSSLPSSSSPLSSSWRRLALGRLAARRLGLRVSDGAGWVGVAGALLAGSALAAQGSILTSERLGTLFYSPSERVAIVRARQDEPEAPANSSLMTVNGVVKRHGGSSTAWVNGRAVLDGQRLSPVTRVGVTERGVTLDGKPVRVGESLDLSTRERSDIVAPGAVTTRSKP